MVLYASKFHQNLTEIARLYGVELTDYTFIPYDFIEEEVGEEVIDKALNKLMGQRRSGDLFPGPSELFELCGEFIYRDYQIKTKGTN